MTPGVCRKPLLKLASQGFQTRCVSAPVLLMAALAAAPKARNARDVLGSRPAAEFLTAAAQQRLEAEHVVGQNQRADALGPADLVRRKRQQIGLQRH